MSGMEDCVVAGGTEMMSYTAQLAAQEANAGIKPLGMGAGHAALDALHPQSHQGVCGDAIAAIEGIDREAVDAQIGRAHVCTPVPNAHIVCRPLLEDKHPQVHIARHINLSSHD